MQLFLLYYWFLIKKKKIESISIENNTNNEQLLTQEEEKHNKEKYKLGLKKIFKNIRIYKLLFIFFFTSFLQGFIFTVGFNFGTMDHGDDIEKLVEMKCLLFLL